MSNNENRNFGFKEKIYLIFVVSLILFFIFSNFNLTKNNIDKNKIDKNREKIIEILEKKGLKKDTDGDGLLDWEEKLYHTNPEIVDTDKDGVSDFDEVKEGRDPTLFGVGKVEKKKALINKNRELEFQKNIQLAFNKNNRKENSRGKKKTVSDFLIQGEKKYDNSGVMIDEKEKKKIRIELNFLASQLIYFKDQRKKIEDSEIADFFDSLFKNNGEIKNKEKIEFLTNLYLDTSKRILKYDYKVSEVKNFALNLSKKYQNIGLELELLNEEKIKDKNISLKKYAEEIEKILLTRTKINNFIKREKVEFLGSEPGRYLKYEI